MAARWPAELLELTTADGLPLGAAFYEPATRRRGAVDAVLLVHGSMGTFTSPVIRGVAERLAAAGWPVLAADNRGHHVAWSHRGTLYGHAYDVIADTVLDIGAALDWLAGRGLTRVGLFGRSLGGTKVVYYQGRTQDPRIATVLAVAPSALSYRVISEHEARGPSFAGELEQARRLVEAGRGRELVDCVFTSGSTPISAATLWDEVGGETYALDRWGAEVTVPLLVLRGDRDGNREVVLGSDLLPAAAVRSPRVDYVIVPGADHSFSGLEDRGAQALIDWLTSLG